LDGDYRGAGNFIIHFNTNRSTPCGPVDAMAAQEAEHGPGRVRELSQGGAVLRSTKPSVALGDQMRLLSGGYERRLE